MGRSCAIARTTVLLLLEHGSGSSPGGGGTSAGDQPQKAAPPRRVMFVYPPSCCSPSNTAAACQPPPTTWSVARPSHGVLSQTTAPRRPSTCSSTFQTRAHAEPHGHVLVRADGGEPVRRAPVDDRHPRHEAEGVRRPRVLRCPACTSAAAMHARRARIVRQPAAALRTLAHSTVHGHWGSPSTCGQHFWSERQLSIVESRFFCLTGHDVGDKGAPMRPAEPCRNSKQIGLPENQRGGAAKAVPRLSPAAGDAAEAHLSQPVLPRARLRRGTPIKPPKDKDGRRRSAERRLEQLVACTYLLDKPYRPCPSRTCIASKTFTRTTRLG